MEKVYLTVDDDFGEADDEGGKRFFVLVIYDIICDKRRRYMVKTLESFGMRVQKSAFECVLDRRRYDRLIKQAPKCIDEKEDSLRIYILSGRMSVLSWGCETNTDISDILII